MKFDAYHPMINFIYFTAVIAFTIWFKHPVFIAVGYLSAFVYAVKLGGVKALIFNVVLMPLIILYAGFYAYYHHFGVTVLAQNIIDNSITLEAVVYGGVLGVIIATVLMWMSCLHRIFSTDKIIYLFGRVSPKISLFISILLRTVPRIKKRVKKINNAQRAIGRGSDQGNIFRRCLNVLRQISMIITWSIENFTEVSDSMRCRGYGLRGRTAFSIYRFDNRDRSMVIAVFICITILLMGVLFDQTTILYDPQLIFNRVTVLSIVFYAADIVLCMMPLGLQIIGEKRFDRRMMYIE